MRFFRLLRSSIPIFLLVSIACSPEDGANGADGLAGLNCHDANGDGINQDSEDINNDGQWNYLDCQGITGDQGNDGNSGTSCWDTNGNGQVDPGEDINNDGNLNGLDCQGMDGESGESLEIMTQYGYITLNLDGTRPDDQPFENDATFKFLPVNGNFQLFYNHVEAIDTPDGTVHDFVLRRYISTPGITPQDTFVEISFSIVDLGGTDELVQSGTFWLDHYAVIGADNKYFTISANFDMEDNTVLNFQISNVDYNLETMHLTFDYSFTSTDGDQNDTLHNLDISGSANVWLLEDIG
ncbi:hypothetical protein [Flagellimonas flava]|uniref:hypothetical protein n=1 Tax=Flagellimonas flava TaxID=570519 RepID=UPI003D661932